jgi:hypothetical protein
MDDRAERCSDCSGAIQIKPEKTVLESSTGGAESVWNGFEIDLNPLIKADSLAISGSLEMNGSLASLGGQGTGSGQSGPSLGGPTG